MKTVGSRRSPDINGKKESACWGKHLIIDSHGIEEQKLKDAKAIKGLLLELPTKLRMRILHKPVIKKVASDDYPDWGISGFVMLYESHISLHTWPEEGYVAIDIYSCKNFDDKKAAAYLKKFWNSKKETAKIVIRK